MYLTHLLFICAWIVTTTGSSRMFGNNVTAGTNYIPSSGKKVWVDADVMLERGTLEKYFIYVHNVTTGLLPYIRLQIWTPVESDMEIRYRLKWEKVVILTEVDRLREFELKQSEKIKVTESDRIGFCSEEDVTPVSMTIGHRRTHFRIIENDEFPVVNKEYTFDPTPFPAAFSIAISTSDETLTDINAAATKGEMIGAHSA
ncbi:hypothetical protein LSAT2_005694 [Lamellibrachia satsuma]|nr:hypothetical protein LSAT2_005694 [Lamellibrachia satsuma]